MCQAPVEWDATYCAACGKHLDDAVAGVDTAATSSSPPRSRFAPELMSVPAADFHRDEEVVRWATARRERLAGAVDDPIDEENAGEDRRPNPLATVAIIAAAIAAVVTVGVALSQHTVFLERMPDKRDAKVSAPVTQPRRAPAVVDSAPRPPASTPARPAPEAKVAAQSKGVPEAKVAAQSKAALAREPSLPPARTGATSVTKPAPETKAAAETKAAETKAEAPIGLPPRELPVREPEKQVATTPAEDSAEPARVASSPTGSSEERMAAFLVDELGAKAAAKKALSNANWYEAGRSERQYWYRVADAVTRRGGR